MKSVSQGEHRGFRSEHPALKRHGLPGGFGPGIPGPQFHLFQRDFPLLPGHGDDFHEFLSPRGMDELLERLPDDVRERLEKFHLGSDDTDDTKVEIEITVEGPQS